MSSSVAMNRTEKRQVYIGDRSNSGLTEKLLERRKRKITQKGWPPPYNPYQPPNHLSIVFRTGSQMSVFTYEPMSSLSPFPGPLPWRRISRDSRILMSNASLLLFFPSMFVTTSKLPLSNVFLAIFVVLCDARVVPLTVVYRSPMFVPSLFKRSGGLAYIDGIWWAWTGVTVDTLSLLFFWFCLIFWTQDVLKLRCRSESGGDACFFVCAF